MSTRIENLFYNLKKSSGKWSNYFDIYEKHFEKFLGKKINLLEIGISKGGSLELWHAYFGELCSIYGIDIDPKTAELEFDFNVDIAIGDQRSSEFWKSYTSTYPKFDIVIDDGGHGMDDQTITLLNVFPHLNDGGIFLVEDLHTSYCRDYGGRIGNPNTFLERSKSLIDMLNLQHIEGITPKSDFIDVFTDLYSISFYNSVAIFEKRKINTPKPVDSYDKRGFTNM